MNWCSLRLNRSFAASTTRVFPKIYSFRSLFSRSLLATTTRNKFVFTIPYGEISDRFWTPRAILYGMKKHSVGFTLIEILVVLTVISILSSVVYMKFNSSSAQARDAERQADLRNLQNAIELYKEKYGRYPEGCNGPDQWAGQLGTTYACNGSTGIYANYDGTGEYIIGLEDEYDKDNDGDKTDMLPFVGEFIPVLPKDPKLNGDDSGYIYVTNDKGTVYKLMAKNTVESETVKQAHPFASCDTTYSGASSQGGVDCDPADNSGKCDVAICDRIYPTLPSTYGGQSVSAPDYPFECRESHAQFKKTYGLWGGWAADTTVGYPSMKYTARREYLTELIACKI